MDEVQTKTAAAAPAWSLADASGVLVAMIWGANFTVIKAALDQIPPLAFVTVRFTIGSLLLLLLLYVREGSIAFPRGSFRKLLILGFIGNTLYQLCFMFGLSLTTAANSAMLLASMPVVITLLGAILKVERMEPRMAWSVGQVTLGIILIVATQGGIHLSSETLRGDLLILLGVLCWSTYTLGVRRLGSDLSSLQVTAWTAVIGTPGLLLVGAGAVGGLAWGQVTLVGWGGLAYATLLALIVAYALWNNSVQRVGSTRTAIYFSMTPLVATVVAATVLHEELVPLQIVGAVLIVTGVLLARK